MEVLLGALLSWITSKVGEWFPNVNNLIVLMALAFGSAIVGTVGYWFLTGMGYWDLASEYATNVSVNAVVIYQVYVNAKKAYDEYVL